MLSIVYSAHAAKYAIVCTVPCVVSDGTTQPAGTTINAPVEWNGVSPWTPPPNTQAVPYTGQVAYSPVTTPTVPTDVTIAQAKAALAAAPSVGSPWPGPNLLADANAAIASTGQYSAASIAWGSGGVQVLHRADALVAQMAAVLGLSSAQVDALFIAAAQITF